MFAKRANHSKSGGGRPHFSRPTAMKYANWRTAPCAVRQFAPAKGYIFRESFIQHDNIEVLKTGKVAVFIGWYSQITIHFQRVLLAGAYPDAQLQPPERLQQRQRPGDDQQRQPVRGDHDLQEEPQPGGRHAVPELAVRPRQGQRPHRGVRHSRPGMGLGRPQREVLRGSLRDRRGPDLRRRVHDRHRPRHRHLVLHPTPRT